MTNITLQVKGMSCQHCVDAVEKALKEVGASGTVALQAGTVDVSFNEGAVSVEQIKAAIEEQGYDVVG